MKKGMGISRALAPLSREELEGMPTGALLARLKRLRWCEDDLEWCDMTEGEVASVSHLILFKSEPAWKRAYAEVKEVLALREHLDRKP
ncbi:hypothetical protein AAG612_04020 [Citromicrobium bathyomarinum]|uniref:hypothetical protein n=1 Tax=Citromicrobium bathyomarinum TaxID=72174 RepID=UPI003159F7A4